MDNALINVHYRKPLQDEGCCKFCKYNNEDNENFCQKLSFWIPNTEFICDEYEDSDLLKSIESCLNEAYALRDKDISEMTDAELETERGHDKFVMLEYAKRQEKRQNWSEAIRAYKSAGDQGVESAYYHAGIIADNMQSYRKAANLYKLGYKMGDEWCAYRLGCLYYYKQISGLFADSKARRCLLYAARKGIPNAQSKYAVYLIEHNRNIEASENSGEFWLMCALLNGDQEVSDIIRKIRSGLTENTLEYYDKRLFEIKHYIIENRPEYIPNYKS